LQSLLHAQSDVTPLDPGFRRLPEIARRTGELNCERGRAEAYGMSVHMIEQGRLDQRPRWAVEHILCDTAVTAKELLMYEGGTDTIPAVSLASRIGPIEINSFAGFLASADLDQDGYIVGSVADSLYLLIVATISDFAGNDVLERRPLLRLFSLRRGERWGRNGVRCRPVWTMWNRPPVLHEAGVQALDHDGDGAIDVAFFFQGDPFAEAASVSVLYGTPQGYPDSASLQTVHLLTAGGRASLLEDITGDGVPELVAHAGGAELLRIYVGIRGRRLLDQYGTGADTARPGDPEWWGRPWATLRLPRAFGTG